MIVENIHNNFSDYSKFFSLFAKVLRIYDKDTEVSKNTIALFNLVARALIKIDAESAEMMFEEILLPELIKLA